MKRQLITFIFTIISLTILFGVCFHFFYAIKNITAHPFKETLSMTLTFLGSVGTLASIIFAAFSLIDQAEHNKEEEKKVILRSKAQLLIRVEEIYPSKDSNGQPALAIDFKVENYNNDASSFNLGYDNSPDNKKNLIVEFDYPHNRTNIFKSGENLNISAIITSPTDILNPPKLEDINLYIKAVYLDKLNNIIEDYYLLTPSNNKSVKISGVIKSNIIAASGRFIEI